MCSIVLHCSNVSFLIQLTAHALSMKVLDIGIQHIGLQDQSADD